MNGARSYSLAALNLVLHGFHQAWIVFTLIGWMFCATRIPHLIVSFATLASWYVLGPLLKKGDAFGYCVITDVQWEIRRRLGLEECKGGYVKYLGDQLFGADFDESLADKIVAAVFFACILASLIMIYLYGSCALFSSAAPGSTY